MNRLLWRNVRSGGRNLPPMRVRYFSSVGPDLPLKKLMAANRGEIAVRILRAGHELNMRTASIYSYEDRHTAHRYKVSVGKTRFTILYLHLHIHCVTCFSRCVGGRRVSRGEGKVSRRRIPKCG